MLTWTLAFSKKVCGLSLCCYPRPKTKRCWVKAVTIEKFGGINQVKISQVPTPEPLDNEVQIAIEASDF